MVARDLAAQGYRNVREYKGGKQDWIAGGFPTEGEHPTEPLPGH
jgi:rhodanese-related sulfurtransferase